MFTFCNISSCSCQLSTMISQLGIKSDEGIFVHFYTESLRREEPYRICAHPDDIYIAGDFWQPCVTQTPLGITLFVCCLRSLQSFIKRREGQMAACIPQLLRRLRQWLGFPPAVLALQHLLEGIVFNFEKHLLANTFYQWMRKLLPTNIPGMQ